MGPAQQRLFEHADAIMEATGWTRSRTLDHQKRHVPNEWDAAARERETERQLKNPKEFFMQEMKQYDKGNHDQFVKATSKLFQSNPDFSRAYDDQVLSRGDSRRFSDANAKLDRKVREHMEASGEKSYKVAVDHVTREDPALFREWHYAGRRAKPPAR